MMVMIFSHGDGDLTDCENQDTRVNMMLLWMMGMDMVVNATTPPPSDKKSPTWSETLGISYPRRHGPGVQWNGLGSIWKALGSSWNGLGFNWNGLGSNVKALNQERAVIQKNQFFGTFCIF